jgi:hypothetical protein
MAASSPSEPLRLFGTSFKYTIVFLTDTARGIVCRTVVLVFGDQFARP